MSAIDETTLQNVLIFLTREADEGSEDEEDCDDDPEEEYDLLADEAECENTADRFGSNIDDAYQGGYGDGRRALAREVKRMLEFTGKAT